MKQNTAVGLLAASVVLAMAVLIMGATSLWVVAIAGFFFVVGGTLLTAVISETFERVRGVILWLPEVFSLNRQGLQGDEAIFLRVAEVYRRGSVRRAEMHLKSLADPFLRQGAQLVVDRSSREELERSLLWQISAAKEQEKQRLRILYSMAGFAPAFGMLGTLLGLVRLLFSLGDSGLESVGAAMGFAMITTVYGLVVANLVIKPIAIKVEHQSRERLAWWYLKYELL
ncbi:MAG TPA: hypothetical protein EYH03_00430, partial [Chromatiales bacterium]|nr:hypothetical protein [Chromatiales bacterium]